MKNISSITNPLIKSIIQLHHNKGRREQQRFIAEGLRTCQTILESKLSIETLIVTEATLEQAEAIARGTPIVIVGNMIMNKIAPTKTPSGILAVVHMPKPRLPETIVPGLVLYAINDPGNMGTLIRSSVAFGYSQIIVIDGVDVYNPKVIQASAGTIGHAVIVTMSWQQLLQHKKRPALCALVAHGGTVIKPGTKKQLLVVGSEAHGIPIALIEQCDQKLTLAMPGAAESLNAAIAGSIALYMSIVGAQ